MGFESSRHIFKIKENNLQTCLESHVLGYYTKISADEGTACFSISTHMFPSNLRNMKEDISITQR